MTDKNPVRAFYDAGPEREWARLETAWLEKTITWRFLEKHLRPPPARILDIGGGPGRYAIDLAKTGYAVDLADLSPASIALAEEKAREARIKLNSAQVADARDLSAFNEASYDLVLCLGPLYHLHEEADRASVVHECLRLAKPGGILFFGFISSLAPYFYLLKTHPENFPKKSDFYRDILKDGRYKAPAGNDSFFTDAFFVDPEAIAPFMSDFPLSGLEIFGAESIATQSEATLATLEEPTRDLWLDHLFDLASSNAAHFNAEHLVFVGRKQATGAP